MSIEIARLKRQLAEWDKKQTIFYWKISGWV